MKKLTEILHKQMARKLQDRLALASYKTRHGQENLSFDDVEACLEKAIQRKRPNSSVGTSSTASSSSFEHQAYSRRVTSSPLTLPFSSEDVRSSGIKRPSKRSLRRSMGMDVEFRQSKRIRSRSMAPPFVEATRVTWKTSHNLPESSPSYRHLNSNRPNLSFNSEVSTIPASPPFGHISGEEEEQQEEVLPTHSFTLKSAFRASPPCTPSPTRGRNARQRKTGGEEGADLLLYLAASPSPANPGIKTSRLFAPATPPSNAHALPSSMMHTPGMTGFSTPGQNFNFADFVNVTPSPAQGAFGNRTPGPAKTPLAAKEARRRLNFDSLIPPGGSPILSNVGRGINKDSGLGMELGGELVSS